MKKLWLCLTFLGATVPLTFYVPYFASTGFGPGNFLSALFANGASGGFAVDLTLSAVAFWILIFSEARVKKPWVLVGVTVVIGLSCALPLYLFLRTNSQHRDVLDSAD